MNRHTFKESKTESVYYHDEIIQLSAPKDCVTLARRAKGICCSGIPDMTDGAVTTLTGVHVACPVSDARAGVVYSFGVGKSALTPVGDDAVGVASAAGGRDRE